MESVLVVDDELDICNFFQYFLRKFNLNVELAGEIKEARKKLVNNEFDLVILDLKLPDGNGIDFLEEIKLNTLDTRVIIITGVSTISTAVESIKKGAFDYIEKPFDDLDELKNIIQNALSRKGNEEKETAFSKTLRGNIGFVLGENKKMRQIRFVAQTIAQKDIPVLITGETGTGKEVLARYIHGMSKRSYNPLVPFNCSAFTESLLESQLFGHERGAFTDAVAAKKGLFELASNGTLFLDEIGEASKNVQVKLLRVLDTGEFNRIGSETTKQANCRIIAATNLNLEEAVLSGSFRKDLYYRLNVVNLQMPPLRERKDDIPALAEQIAQTRLKKNICFTPNAIAKLQNYSWPGNIRELNNVISRALAFTTENVIEENHLQIQPEKSLVDDNTISDHDNNGHYTKFSAPKDNLPNKLLNWFEQSYSQHDELDLNEIKTQLENAKTNLIKTIVTQTLKETMGDRKQAAQKLNISTRTLRYILKEK